MQLDTISAQLIVGIVTAGSPEMTGPDIAAAGLESCETLVEAARRRRRVRGFKKRRRIQERKAGLRDGRYGAMMCSISFDNLKETNSDPKRFTFVTAPFHFQKSRKEKRKSQGSKCGPRGRKQFGPTSSSGILRTEDTS
jgi:hypothetical protein